MDGAAQLVPGPASLEHYAATHHTAHPEPLQEEITLYRTDWCPYCHGRHKELESTKTDQDRRS